MSTTDILLSAAGSDILFTRSTFTRIVTAGSGTIAVPTGARGMRVAVIGAGGPGSTSRRGGGGGGCAATKIIAAMPVAYSVGSSGSASTATFSGYSLVGGGGSSGSAGRAGGVGSGGDFNYTGSSGQTSGGGGGAAAPLAWGVPFGGIGLSAEYSLANSYTGGGGSGAPAGSAVSGGAAQSGYPVASLSSFTGLVWGNSSGSAITYSNTVTYEETVSPGGVMGGGGGAGQIYSAVGGVGGIVVEWFYIV